MVGADTATTAMHDTVAILARVAQAFGIVSKTTIATLATVVGPWWDALARRSMWCTVDGVIVVMTKSHGLTARMACG